MNIDEVIKLEQLPEDKRTQYAYHLMLNEQSLMHDLIKILDLLPIKDRAAFIQNNILKIGSPYIFALALGALPENLRLDCAKDYYSYFSLERRRASVALANILSSLPEKARLEFAISYRDEILTDASLCSVLRELPESHRFEFSIHFKTLFISAYVTMNILKLLPEKNRLMFFAESIGDGLLQQFELEDIMQLIPSTDIEKFLEINLQRILRSCEINQHITREFGLAHPIYYSLQRVFDAIQVREEDIAPIQRMKLSTYAKLADFFNDRYSIQSEPYHASRDHPYRYIRELESKSVSSLITRESPLREREAELITQYSEHAFDRMSCEIELKSFSPVEAITWNDLIYLHKHTLGLRGVTDDDMAVNEAKKGGRGDAISLACFGMSRNMILPFSVLMNHQKMQEKYPQVRETLLQSFKEGVEQHISASLNFGYSVAFTLMDRGPDALHPYDHQSYPLGKCGKADFKPSQIKKIILRNDKPNWDVKFIYQVVVKEIKNLRQMQQSAKLPIIVTQKKSQKRRSITTKGPLVKPEITQSNDRSWSTWLTSSSLFKHSTVKLKPNDISENGFSLPCSIL